LEPERLAAPALPRFDPGLLEGLVQPLLDDLSQRLARGEWRPVLALNGPVGAGKTSLARLLEDLAPRRGLRLAVASIDDAYLPWAERLQRLAGNPFGVTRVPPGSHDLPLLLQCLADWRRGDPLRLPRFDKTLCGGQGDRAGWVERPADALVLEGWLMGCRPLGTSLASALQRHPLQPPPSPAEAAWLPRWDRWLADYGPLWEVCSGLWLLRPAHWGLPRRWRFQAEARQRRAGGGWLNSVALAAMVNATLRSLPPALYQDPLLRHPGPGHDPFRSDPAAPPEPSSPEGPPRDEIAPQQNPPGRTMPLLGGVVLDGRRRARPLGLPQPSASSASSAIG
jgi:D-glycerate 3-kinase